MRDVPSRVRMVTMPGCSSFTRSNDPRIAAQPDAAASLRESVRRLGRDNRDEFPFICHVERIESQHLACALDFVADGNRALLQLDAHLDRSAISLSELERPPRVGSRRQRISELAPSISATKRMQRRGIALHRRFRIPDLRAGTRW